MKYCNYILFKRDKRKKGNKVWETSFRSS
uniref:Uncharacterized protein n=1 Tax=Anguilla anguilla TaxID=7936 RepID=A0A0E9T6Q2_ANGAN